MGYSKEKTVIDLSDAVNISDLVIKISPILEADGVTNKEVYLNLGNINLKQSQLLSIKALIETMQSKLLGVQTTSDMTEASAIGLGLEVGDFSKPEKPSFNDTFNKVAENTEVVTGTDELSSFAQLKKINSIGDFVTDAQTLAEVQADETLEKETEEFLAEAAEEDVEASDLFAAPEKDETNIYAQLEQEMNTQPSDEVQSALDIAFGAKTDSDEVNEEEYEVFAKPQQIYDKFEDYEVTETVEKTEEDKYILLDTEGITPEGIELIKSNTSDLPTLYLTQTLRSGQTVSYEGNIFIIGDAHPGSEVNATGDVTIWGILGGIVHAGSKGNTDAKVRALKLNPIQLRIANLYSRRNDTVNVPYVQKTNEFTPEEARIENNQIVIYKTLRRED
ncbi:MAG: hypothetical protein NC200_08410 [Candidatus Gastranaerophilales bacterium]|nr:hypothetical protein [Candidatus Gastranaerophilales bacterium]